MLANPVLFSRFGVAWTLVKCCLVLGGVALILGGALFAILFKHTGAEARRLSAAEAGRVALYPATGSMVPTISGKGVGVGVELSCSIDSLRKAAHRGDWLTFWLWPVLMTAWVGGCWLLFMAVALKTRFTPAVIAASVPCALILFVAWFMPWAALHTKIDLDADSPGTADHTAH